MVIYIYTLLPQFVACNSDTHKEYNEGRPSKTPFGRETKLFSAICLKTFGGGEGINDSNGGSGSWC